MAKRHPHDLSRNGSGDDAFPRVVYLHHDNPHPRKAIGGGDSTLPLLADAVVPDDLDDGTPIAVYVLREVKQLRITRRLE